MAIRPSDQQMTRKYSEDVVALEAYQFFTLSSICICPIYSFPQKVTNITPFIIMEVSPTNLNCASGGITPYFWFSYTGRSS